MAGVLLALFTTGCVDLESAGFQTDDEEDSADEEVSDDENQNRISEFSDALSDADVEVLELESDGEELSLRIQTRGDIDEDLNRVASVYSGVIENLSEDLSLVIEDRGLTQEEFFIEREWALDHSEGRMTDEAYLQQIRGEEAD